MGIPRRNLVIQYMGMRQTLSLEFDASSFHWYRIMSDKSLGEHLEVGRGNDHHITCASGFQTRCSAVPTLLCGQVAEYPSTFILSNANCEIFAFHIY